MKKNKEFRIVFFASGDFPIPTLKHLISEGYNIVGVVSSNDKIRFNDKKIGNIAMENDIPLFIPQDLESEDFISWLTALNPDIFMVISYKMLPQKVLDIPNINSFNIHASSLPYLKGAAPINWAIYHGFEEIGMTAFLLNNRMDGGNIIASRKHKIYKVETFGDVFNFLAIECSTFAQFIMDYVFTDENYYMKSIPQINFKYNDIINITTNNCFITPNHLKSINVTNIFNAPKLNGENTKINWNTSVKRIYDQIRAFSPYPGAIGTINIKESNKDKKLLINRYEIKIIKATLVKVDSLPDEIRMQIQVSNTSNIITNKKSYLFYFSMIEDDQDDQDEVLRLDEVQLLGKKVMPIKDFLNGFRFFTENSTFNFY